MSENDEIDDLKKRIDVESKKSLKNTAPKLDWKVLSVILLIVLLLSAGFIYWQYIREKHDSSPEAVVTKNLQESDRVINKLSIILLTESEDAPTVARIEDPAVLQKANAEFYKNAQAGDYLILYPNRAIIFRESENRVINVAPIINSSQITPEASKQQ